MRASWIPICEDCLASFERIAEPMCQTCRRPFTYAIAAQMVPSLCRLCRARFFGFDRARSYANCNDALGKAIVLLKYEEVRPLGRWFAERLAEGVREYAEAFRVDVVVPVPLHPDRQRERGYNQAELVASPGEHAGHSFGAIPTRTEAAAASQVGAFADRAVALRTWRLRHA